jgi:hypothetical protein
MRSTLLAGAAALATVVLVLAAATPADADLYVLESTAATVGAGTHLASDQNISLPAGSYIRAVLPSGKTQTIKGPFNGTAADFDKGPQNEGVLAWLRGMLATGGSKEITPGATRGIRREPPAASAFSWSAVPATADATVCLIKGAKVELVRPVASRAERVGIIDAASGARGEAQWEAGSAATPWPAALPARADATYYLLIADRPQRQLTLRLLDATPADEDVLVALQRLGCRPQFEAWVRERLGTGGPRR